MNIIYELDNIMYLQLDMSRNLFVVRNVNWFIFRSKEFLLLTDDDYPFTSWCSARQACRLSLIQLFDMCHAILSAFHIYTAINNMYLKKQRSLFLFASLCRPCPLFFFLLPLRLVERKCKGLKYVYFVNKYTAKGFGKRSGSEVCSFVVFSWTPIPLTLVIKLASYNVL